MDTQSIDALFNQSLQLFKAGKFSDAAVGLRQVVAARPGDARARTLLGACLGQTGKHAEAVEQFLELTRLDPGNPVHYCNLGKAYRSCGNLTHAEGAYRKAIEINPGHEKATEALNSLASLKNEVLATQAVPPPAHPPPQQAPAPPTGPAGNPVVTADPTLGLNWGAFLLAPFWSVAHRTQFGLWCLLPFLLLPPHHTSSHLYGTRSLTYLFLDVLQYSVSVLPSMGLVTGWPLFVLYRLIPAIFAIGIPTVLLFKGNKWGWQNRAFSSVDEFQRVQRIWMYWGLVFLAVGIISVVIGVVGGSGGAANDGGGAPPVPVRI